MIKLRSILKETLEDKAENVTNEENVTEEVNAKSLGITDDLGKFFIVTRPDKDSVKEDILDECDIISFATRIKGGLNFEEIVGVYKQKSDASREATQLLKNFQSELNELENEMEEYRKHKSDLDGKRKAAIDRIKKMKGE